MTAPLDQIAALEAQLALLKKQAPDAAPPAAPVATLLRLDIGCGKNKREGFTGVDQFAMPGVDVVADVRQPWPWKDATVDEVHCSHFAEHLTALERVAFWNELWRVLKPGAKATVITPNWSSSRAYGDPTHQWPPLGSFTFLYLNKDWRKQNAPHTDAEWLKGGFACDFDHQLGYSIRPDLQARNPEFVAMALGTQIEAGQDVIATLVKKG